MGERKPNIPPEVWEQMGEEARLRKDLDVANAYCDEHAAESSGVRIDQGPPMRIIACFTDNISRHEQALRKLVEHPDHLVVEQVRFSQSELRQIVEEIQGIARFPGVGCGVDHVSVMLGPGQEGLADNLRTRYGDILRIRHGIVVAAPMRPNGPATTQQERRPGFIARLLRLVFSSHS